MPRRQRDYRAEYQARIAKGRELGLRGDQAAGHGKRSGRPSITDLRAQGVIPARPTKAPRVLRTTQGPKGSAAHRTGSKDSAMRLVKQAADRGERVSVRGTFRTSGGWRTVTLDGSTAEQASFLGRQGGAGGEGGGKGRVGRMDAFHRRAGRGEGRGVIEVRTVPDGGAGGKGKGAKAADVWGAWMAWAAENDGDWWDFLADWADSEYG